ncbi:MAG TPA: DNA methyltransferase [Thermoanaerobaculia bacterium]|nr:DNA methyltransferase [Thermoanaerobaculia bacterium]
MAKHPLHSLCSYLGGFPPHVPRELLARWVEPAATVLDPFCGGGTTLLEAAASGRCSIGFDLNPLAVAISQAKTQDVMLDDVLFRLNILAGDFPGAIDLAGVPEEIQIFYHDRTISQLLYLRECLDGTPEDVFIRGAVLGIMHGKWRRDGSSAYLSIDMPNTFSMSPDYVRRFVIKNKLAKRPVDVFSRLRERVRWLLREGPAARSCAALVAEADATNLSQALERLGRRNVDAILTSPPYLGVLRYGAFNWLRLWFLDCDAKAVDARLDATDSLDKYLSFFLSFLIAAAATLKSGSPLILVVGDVIEDGQHIELAARVWEELKGVTPFSLEAMFTDDFDENGKTTRIWGEERRGRATPRDRILVLRRS